MAKWQILFSCFSFLTGTALFSGCASSSSTQAFKQQGNSSGEQIVGISKRLVGSPYRYGGESPNGFDCSGLVRYVYRKIGITVPHSSRLLYRQSHKVNLSNLQPGDLLFFNISKNKVSHVGIYAAKGQFIHAPSSGKKVSIARLDNPYWKQRLLGAGRFH